MIDIVFEFSLNRQSIIYSHCSTVLAPLEACNYQLYSKYNYLCFREASFEYEVVEKCKRSSKTAFSRVLMTVTRLVCL